MHRLKIDPRDFIDSIDSTAIARQSRPTEGREKNKLAIMTANGAGFLGTKLVDGSEKWARQRAVAETSAALLESTKTGSRSAIHCEPAKPAREASPIRDGSQSTSRSFGPGITIATRQLRDENSRFAIKPRFHNQESFLVQRYTEPFARNVGRAAAPRGRKTS